MTVREQEQWSELGETVIETGLDEACDEVIPLLDRIARLYAGSGRSVEWTRPGRKPAVIRGESYYWTTACTARAGHCPYEASGEEHPVVMYHSAYERAYGRTEYHSSTRRVEVSIEWMLAAMRMLARLLGRRTTRAAAREAVETVASRLRARREQRIARRHAAQTVEAARTELAAAETDVVQAQDSLTIAAREVAS